MDASARTINLDRSSASAPLSAVRTGSADLLDRSQPLSSYDASQPRSSYYGEKSIGFKSSICLITNNIMGPAMVALPYLCQQAGLIPCLVVNSICGLCSGLGSTMLCVALQRIPGNSQFDGVDPNTGERYEYCDAVDFYWSERPRVCTFIRILFNISLQAQNIPAMVISCQMFDDFLTHVLHFCWGVKFNSWPPEPIHCEATASLAITSGVILTMFICIPFGLLNLDQNKIFQNISFICLVVLVAEFLVEFAAIGPFVQHRGLEVSRTPLFTGMQQKTIGVILFSWCFPSTLPSWANEKKPNFSSTLAIWMSVVIGWTCKGLVMVLGAWAYDLVTRKSQQDAQNILLVMDHTDSSWLTQACAYLFNFATLIPGIPIIAVIVRYNLLSSGKFGTCGASFFGVVLPWIATVLLYRQAFFVDVLNWGAMLCMGPVNFVIPPLLCLSALRRFPQTGTRKEKNQVQIPRLCRLNPKCLAVGSAALMGGLVGATTLVNIFYMVILGKDIVDG